MTGAGPRLRFFLGAFGEAGHAFPMLALGRRLVERGHEVTFETWSRWREHVEQAGMRFEPAPEFPVFGDGAGMAGSGGGFPMYEAVVLATGQTRKAVAGLRPDLVVHDILTLAPAMAGELEGVPVATLIPHVYPVGGPGFPPYALGARYPRTRGMRVVWDAVASRTQGGLRQGRDQLNATRAKLGLAPVARLHGGLSERLILVATFPQLEYPRRWPPGVHVVGPLMWEPPYHAVEPPAGRGPVVLVAPSTAQDPEHRLLRISVKGLGGLGGRGLGGLGLDGLGDEPIRVLATWNRRPLPPREALSVAENVRLVEWVSYSQTMPGCAAVICHAGHGTMVRALASGCPVVAVPHCGDMAENAARADWAGVGVRLPWRLLGPETLRLAVRRALSDPSLRARAGALARWAAAHDGASRAAELVEGLATRERQPPGGRARMNSSSSGESPSTTSIGSPVQLQSSTTARSSVNSSGRQTAP